jgi:uncharacterized membrane protein
MEPAKKSRILFLDMMRFLALFMMIQGHTVYAMLDKEIREGGSTGIYIWTFFRGYTAPFFMVIAGAVFTFLLIQENNVHVRHNMRIRKGLTRVMTLLFWGYLLRFPIHALWSRISQGATDVAIAVDVLHIIGLGLLTVMTVFALSRRFIAGLMVIYLSLFIVVAYVSPHITTVNVHHHPQPVLSPENLGVTLIDNTPELADSLDLLDSDGLFVTDVRSGSKADELGLKPSDVITNIGYQEVCSLTELPIMESRQVYGRYANLKVLRGNQLLDVEWSYDRKVSVFPNFFTMWVNSTKTYSGKSSPFPIFPWISYILFGGFFGSLLALLKIRGRLDEWMDVRMLVLGAILITWSEIGDKIEIQLYGKSNFWGHIEGMGASPNLILHRIGVVILVGAFFALLARFIKKLPPLMNQMSRNTLWLYVGHLVILYWIRPSIYPGRLGVAGTLVCVVVMFILMIAQTKLIEAKGKHGSWKMYLNDLKVRILGKKTILNE